MNRNNNPENQTEGQHEMNDNTGNTAPAEFTSAYVTAETPVGTRVITIAGELGTVSSVTADRVGVTFDNGATDNGPLSHKSYRIARTVTLGYGTPDGDWIDRKLEMSSFDIDREIAATIRTMSDAHGFSYGLWITEGHRDYYVTRTADGVLMWKLESDNTPHQYPEITDDAPGYIVAPTAGTAENGNYALASYTGTMAVVASPLIMRSIVEFVRANYGTARNNPADTLVIHGIRVTLEANEWGDRILADVQYNNEGHRTLIGGHRVEGNAIKWSVYAD